MIPVEERMDLHVHANLKGAVLARCTVKDQTLNECVTELLCQALKLDVADYQIPRRRPGRKPFKHPPPDKRKPRGRS